MKVKIYFTLHGHVTIAGRNMKEILKKWDEKRLTAKGVSDEGGVDIESEIDEHGNEVDIVAEATY